MVKYLILTSSGGNGHIAVAEAEKIRLQSQGTPEQDILLIDIMGLYKQADNYQKPWVPTLTIPGTSQILFSGQTNINQWNQTQKLGGLKSVQKLETLIQLQWIAEAIQGPSIESNLQELLTENPDLIQVIDTQALSTANILQTLGEHNRTNQKHICITKIISEFVTEKIDHFSLPIKKVRREDAPYLTIQTVNEPFIPNKESASAFYTRLFGNAEIQIEKRDEKPLRPAFFEQTPNIHSHPSDMICTITLGSQSSVAILDYIDSFIETVLTTDIPPSKRATLFITTSKDDGSKTTLYAKTCMHLDERMKALEAAGITWPENVQITPLAFQDAKSMASLFKHSDVLIMRSGGISSMEAEATHGINPNRKVYIHTEAPIDKPHICPKANFDIRYEALLKGTVRWEGGNAEYLMQQIDAALTTPNHALFHLDNTETPSYNHSLLQLATEDMLDEAHTAKIKILLNQGSNPNMQGFDGLPLIAHAKDKKTITLLIRYGGKLTEAVKLHLKANGLLDSELEDLARAEATAELRNGYPTEVYAEFTGAIESNHLSTIQGLLYRYPALASCCDTKKANPNIKTMLESNKGIPMLSLELEALQSPNKTTLALLKYQIYLNQVLLNQEDSAGKTSLSYCQNQELQKLMILLGANPYYLPADINPTEKKTLEQLAYTTRQKTATLSQLILKTYMMHHDNKTLFCETLKNALHQEFTHIEAPDDIIETTFDTLKNTQHEVHLMNLIERIVNFIKYLFHADILSERSNHFSKQFMFYQEEAHHEAFETFEANLPTQKSA